MKTSIIVPAHNEEKNIKNFLIALSKKIKNSEIIVVCNGCTDRTVEIARNIKRKNIKQIVLREAAKGTAIIKGLRIAKGDRIGFVDADGAFSADDVARIAKENADCIIASKWKGRDFNSVNSSVGRKIGSRVWNFFVRNLLGLNFSDTQAGLKFFRKKVIKSIGYDFICKGFEFDVELLYKIKNSGFRIKEIYVPVKKIGKTTFNASHAPRMFANLIRVWLGI